VNYEEANQRGEELSKMSDSERQVLWDRAWSEYLHIIEAQGYERRCGMDTYGCLLSWVIRGAISPLFQPAPRKAHPA
jgi:hypothetical protein